MANFTANTYHSDRNVIDKLLLNLVINIFQMKILSLPRSGVSTSLGGRVASNGTERRVSMMGKQSYQVDVR